MKSEIIIGNGTHREGKVIPYRFAGPAAPTEALRAEVERLQKLVVEQHDTIEYLAAQANRDSLTGLANRRGMETALSAMLSDYHRYGHKGAVLMLNLSRFREVGATYGLAAGNALLIHVADILRRHSRESDIVARTGSDTFVMVLREMSAQDANNKALELQRQVRALPCKYNGFSLHAALSIGVATFSEVSEAQALLSLADQRMALAHKARPV